MNKKFTINKPCSENYDTMSDFKMGKFCDKCERNIVDIRDKETFEFSPNKRTCVIGRKSQFSSPYIVKQLASGAMIATSFMGLSSCNKDNSSNPLTEIISKKNSKTLQGVVTNKYTNKPMSNTVIQFIRLDSVFSTKTDENGKFTLNVPSEIIEDKNVIKMSTDLSSDYVFVTKKDFSKSLELKFDDFDEDSLIGELAYDDSVYFYYIDGKKTNVDEYAKIENDNAIKKKFNLYVDGEMAQFLTKTIEVDGVFIMVTEK